MPIRTASLSRQLQKNGQRLHLAMASRAFSQGADKPASETEVALRDERAALKADQKKRQDAAKAPKPKAAKRVLVARPVKAPKAVKPPKEAKAPKELKAGQKAKPSRADKLTKKAENLEAAKKADRKSAKT